MSLLILPVKPGPHGSQGRASDRSAAQLGVGHTVRTEGAGTGGISDEPRGVASVERAAITARVSL